MIRIGLLVGLGLLSCNSFAGLGPGTVSDRMPCEGVTNGTCAEATTVAPNRASLVNPELYTCLGIDQLDSIYIVYNPNNDGYMMFNVHGAFIGNGLFRKNNQGIIQSYIQSHVFTALVKMESVADMWLLTLAYDDGEQDQLVCK
jgi:hypothetical protein